MVRLVALALNAHELQDTCNGDGTLAFGAGLSDVTDPDVHLTDFTGRKRLWIEVGQPEDKPLLKACSQADAVRVYAFAHAADIWWKGIEGKLSRLDKLQVWRLPTEAAHERDGQLGRAQHAVAGHHPRPGADAQQRQGQREPGSDALEVTSLLLLVACHTAAQ